MCVGVDATTTFVFCFAAVLFAVRAHRMPFAGASLATAPSQGFSSMRSALFGLLVVVTAGSVAAYACPLKDGTLHSQAQSNLDLLNSVNEKVSSTGYTPSATPLLLLSPEVSVWSTTDNLFDSTTTHWSGQNMSINGALQVDGNVYSFLGNSGEFSQGLTQVNKIVLPTTTVYQFMSPENIQLTVLFTTAVYSVDSEDLVSQPYTYVTMSVNNTGTAAHNIQLYFDVFADWVLDYKYNGGQQISWHQLQSNDMKGSYITNYDNIPFSLKGDYVKMNWGSVYTVALPDSRVTSSVTDAHVNRGTFASGQGLPASDASGIRSFNNNPPSSALMWNLGSLAPNATDGGFAVVAYDDEFSMNYFGEYQKPLWRQQYKDDPMQMLKAALTNWQDELNQCNSFDQSLFKQVQSVGADSYAILTSLVYRQVTAGIKATYSDSLQDSRWYMKEISSDGDVSTVDVIFPASPFFLQFAPNILAKILLPILDYANNATNIPYNLPWAPHHLGYWPVADISSEEQEQMPVEESANLLCMLAGIAQAQSGNVTWLGNYWPVLQTFANNLISSLPDPGNQLCTDDFEGPSPHNVNLALKGIVGLGAYSKLVGYNGDSQGAAQIMLTAENLATKWMNLSGASAGPTTKLQYDLPGTWSQKYNLLYQNILGLTLFPADMFQQETAYYKSKVAKWGLPLDSRGALTKTDWSSWVAALSGDKNFQSEIYDYLLVFIMQSPSRGVPFSDWYNTDDGTVIGFRARPVQGGIFAQYLLSQIEQQQKQQGLKPITPAAPAIATE